MREWPSGCKQGVTVTSTFSSGEEMVSSGITENDWSGDETSLSVLPSFHGRATCNTLSASSDVSAGEIPNSDEDFLVFLHASQGLWEMVLATFCFRRLLTASKRPSLLERFERCHLSFILLTEIFWL